jgi:hypothetical protein
VSKYFKYCPLCFSKDSIVFEWGWIDDYMFCEDCGARWHINSGLTGFHWASLMKDSIEQKEPGLIGVKKPPHFWLERAIKGRKASRKTDYTSKVVKIVKEVIVKVRCPYCQQLYDETLDGCSYCGGYR